MYSHAKVGAYLGNTSGPFETKIQQGRELRSFLRIPLPPPFSRPTVASVQSA